MKNSSSISAPKPPHVVVMHHYMWPDESPTARLFSDLAFHLADFGCRVSACSVRERYIVSLADLREREKHGGVDFFRVNGGTGFRKGGFARLIAGFLLMWKWFLLSWKLPRADVLIVGTDPPFSVWLAALLKLFRRASKVALWSMDLYPDAIVAEGMAKEGDLSTRVAGAMNLWAFSQCDAVVDLGLCMRTKMRTERVRGRRATIVPWAPHEPESIERDAAAERLREEMFSGARLGLLYSGALGRAHDAALFARLAAELAIGDSGIAVAMSSHGSTYVKFKSRVLAQKWPIKCLDFDPTESYLNRLKAADFHLVSVRPEWTGIVVPSKFFAALAVGRPVIASVNERSSLADLCREYDLGWVLNEKNMKQVLEGLRQFTLRPERLRAWQKHVQEVYKKMFSRKAGLEAWERILE